MASIDIGLKRIGVALCLAASIVTPQEAILRKNRDKAAVMWSFFTCVEY